MRLYGEFLYVLDFPRLRGSCNFDCHNNQCHMGVVMNKLNPGSREAILEGCCCPVLDNARGKGYMGGVKDKDGNTLFIINCNCPLHGKGNIT